LKRGRLFLTCEVKGIDGFSLVDRLQSLKIAVYRIKTEENKTIFSIDYCDRKKFFAISKNMCYNISILKYYGQVSPFKKIVENVGFTLCFACFLALSILFDGYFSKTVYLGDGEYLKPQIQKVFLEEGVKEGSFFNFDEKELAKKIASSSDRFSFVSVKKSGRILYVEAYLKTESYLPIDTKKESIKSTVTGTVKSINLLSGTPKVKVGDRVEVGDVLIDGSYEKDEKIYQLYALGEVEIVAEFKCDYKTFSKGEKYKSRAVAVAIENLGKDEIIGSEVKEKTVGIEFYYEVTLYYGVTVS